MDQDGEQLNIRLSSAINYIEIPQNIPSSPRSSPYTFSDQEFHIHAIHKPEHIHAYKPIPG